MKELFPCHWYSILFAPVNDALAFLIFYGIKPHMETYALNPKTSRGRLFAEAESNTRSVFQRDRDRIIHSGAFRKLQYKTQVFINHEGDYYRTRLTHTLEVAQLARSVARELGLNEDAAEGFALAHDLGHPPFGHAGEEALAEAMKEYGGFDHNAQTLRILTKLEHIYANFDGLNLTWEMLEGIVKHNGPLKKPYPRAIVEYNKQQDLELNSYASLEAQIASLCDDIAYNAHDIDDGLRAKLISFEALAELPFVGAIFTEVVSAHKGIQEGRWIHESKRRIINAMCSDLVATTRKNIAAGGYKTAQEIRDAGKPVAAFSSEMQANIKAVKVFLMKAVYRHYKVNRMTSKARRVLKELFAFFLEEPSCLPPEWQEGKNIPERIADYLAGMTDRYAFLEHKRIFDTNYKLLGG